MMDQPLQPMVEMVIQGTNSTILIPLARAVADLIIHPGIWYSLLKPMQTGFLFWMVVIIMHPWLVIKQIPGMEQWIPVLTGQLGDRGNPGLTGEPLIVPGFATCRMMGYLLL